MKIRFLSIILLISSSQVLAQNTALSKMVKLGEYKHTRITNVVGERNGFVYAIGTNSKNPYLIYNFKSLFLRRYKAEDLSLDQEWEFDNSDIEKSTVYFREFVSTDSGIFVFSETYNKLKKSRSLYVRQISYEGEMLKLKKLFSVPAHSWNVRKFYYNFSPDRSKTMIYVDPNPGDSDEKTALVFVFDGSFNLLSRRIPSVRVDEKTFLRPVDLAVNNRGEAFLLTIHGSENDVEDRFSFIGGDYHILRIHEDDEVISTPIHYPETYIHSAGIGFDNKNRLVFAGFWSLSKAKKVEGYISVVFNNSNLDETRREEEFFSDDIVKRLYDQNNATSSDSSTDFFAFSEFRPTPEGVAIIAEKHQSIDNDYFDIYHQDLVVIRLDLNGKIKNLALIDRNQIDQKHFSEYFLTTFNNKLQLFIYDHQDNPEYRKAAEPVKSPFFTIPGKDIYTATLIEMNAQGDLQYLPVIGKRALNDSPLIFIEKSVTGNNGLIYCFMFTQKLYETYLMAIDPSKF